MRRYKWDYEAALISMAWVSFGELACVLQNGLVLIFSLSDAAPVQVQLRVPNPRGSLQLAACHFSNRSAIFQTTGTNDLYAVTNVAEKSSEPAVPLASLRTAAGVNISSIVCRSNTEKDVKVCPRVRAEYVCGPHFAGQIKPQTTRRMISLQN